MGWFGKVALGSLGLFFGGPLGAILGATLGHHLIDKGSDYPNQTAKLKPAEQTQAAYFISVFSILGKLAKIDGIVSKDEIAVVENFIRSMNISFEKQEFAKRIFNEAKNSRYSIDDFAMQFYQINRQQPSILLSFIDVLFQVAAADGTFHVAEETALKRIKDIFQISDSQFNHIKAIYFRDIDKFYRCLNCTSKSSNEEIKKNYKKLVKDFHPDRIISKGLPEEFIAFASKRFREIQEAYENIKKERGF